MLSTFTLAFSLLNIGRNGWDGSWWVTLAEFQNQEGDVSSLMHVGYDADVHEWYFDALYLKAARRMLKAGS